MYSYILERLVQFNQISDLKLYLRNLQPYVIRLRQSYRSNSVNIDYSDPNTQAAYLLAYYPLYAEMTYQVLCNLGENYLQKCFSGYKELQACFFGAGPAPEIVGLVNYLHCKHSLLRYAASHTYDITANTWSNSQSITKYVASQLSPNFNLMLSGNHLNLCQKNGLYPIINIIKSSQLFIVQNCLNEFIADSHLFLENIGFLAVEMPANSILVIADLCHYSLILDLMNKVESYFDNTSKLEMIRKYTNGICSFQSSLRLPQVSRMVRAPWSRANKCSSLPWFGETFCAGKPAAALA